MSYATTPTDDITQPGHIYFDASVLDTDSGKSAAIGYFITDSGGDELARGWGSLQNFVSSTHAELRALHLVLDHTLSIEGLSRVYVHGDSKSVIEMVDPTHDASANDSILSRMVTNARDATADFEFIHFGHIDRGQNEVADRLARKGHRRPPELGIKRRGEGAANMTQSKNP